MPAPSLLIKDFYYIISKQAIPVKHTAA